MNQHCCLIYTQKNDLQPSAPLFPSLASHFFSVKWLNDLSSNDIILKCVLNESSTVQYKFQLHPINPNQKHLVFSLLFI